MLEQGKLIDGKYRILSEIGHGGMSVVYLAINEKANKTWAIKEVRRDGKNDYNMVRQSLITEIDTLKSVKHPKLPSIVDIIEDEDSFIIVMDYIEGRSLEKILEENGPQPEEYVKEWAKQLCDVLGYLHSCDPPIIYRDMKPSNIMLKPNGEITIIDFGTAKKYDVSLESTTGLGTAGYAAPEQYGGRGRTDERTDIYALGMTLYSLLTNIDPRKTVIADKSIRKINPFFSRGLDKIVSKCTQDDANLRYQSCAELMYDLEHIDQLDESYHRKSKIKLGIFAMTAVLAVCSCFAGVMLNIKSKKSAANYYYELIDKAEKSSNYEDKLDFYKESIEVPGKGGQKEAYLGLINLFKNNDENSKFTDDEVVELEQLVRQHSSELEEDPDNYIDVYYEIGKLFWYHYDSPEQITRAKNALTWFQTVADNSDESYQNHNIAKVYACVGAFYRDIVTSIAEVGEKGMFSDFYNNLLVLMDEVLEDDTENDMVRLELMDMAVSVISQYPSNFRADSITKKQLNDMCDRIQKNLDSIYSMENGDDPVSLKKKTVAGKMANAREMIETVYGKGDKR